MHRLDFLRPATCLAAVFALAGALGATSATAATAATAAPDMKPGLWELSSKVGSADPQVQAAMAKMQQQLAAMSPEQRQAMQDMMRQHGVQLDMSKVGASGGAVRTRMCMTRAMIERKELPVQGGECTQQVTQQSPAHVKVAFTCSKPAASGTGDITFDSATRYHARMQVRSEEQGQDATMDVTGTWVGADCGDILPIATQPAK